MDIRKLQRAIVDGLEDVKAHDILVFNTEHLSSLFERVIIASGTSNRQTKSLAASVRDAVKSKGFPSPRMEGEGNGEWIIVDCGAAVAHIMQPAIRDYYRLEEIWGEKPVKIKMATKGRGLVKASSEDDDEDDVEDAPKKTVTRKTTAGRAKTAAAKSTRNSPGVPKTTATRTAAAKAAPAKKARATPAPAKKAATAAKTAARKTTRTASGAVTRTVGTRSGGTTAVKTVRTPARKTAVKPASKTAARKTRGA